VGFLEHGNESSDSKKDEEYRDQLSIDHTGYMGTAVGLVKYVAMPSLRSLSKYLEVIGLV
jgi:hypothetical protein